MMVLKLQNVIKKTLDAYIFYYTTHSYVIYHLKAYCLLVKVRYDLVLSIGAVSMDRKSN